MTAEPMPALTIDELSGIFKALRAEDPAYSLEDALNETVALAKSKGIGAEQFSAILAGAGIDITDGFQRWLEQTFAEEN